MAIQGIGDINISVGMDIAKMRAATVNAANSVNRMNARMSKSFKAIGRTMKLFGSLAGVYVGGSMLMMGKNAINSADKIQKLSIRLGASTEALSEYRHVAELSGVTFETLTMGWQRMTRRVAEAASGLGESRLALKELGIEATALNKLSPEQQFEVLADAIMGVKNPADQVRLAMKMFDSEGVALLQTMQNGSAGIREMRGEAQKLGITITEDMANGAADANDALTRLSGSIKSGINNTVLEYTDSIAKAAQFMEVAIPKAVAVVAAAFNTLIVVIKTALLAVVISFDELFAAMAKVPLIGEKFKGVSETVSNFRSTMSESLNATISDLNKNKETVFASTESFQKMGESVENTSTALDGVLNPALMGANAETAELTTKLIDLNEQFRAGEISISEYKKQILATTGAKNDLRSHEERFADILRSQRTAQEHLSTSLIKANGLYKDGFFTLSEYKTIIEATTGKTIGLGDTSASTATFISGQFERLKDGVHDSFVKAFRSGESFFGNLKNLTFDILAQIAAKIATTFVFDKLGITGGGSGGLLGGLGSIGKMFSSGGGLTKTISSIFGKGGSLATIATKAGTSIMGGLSSMGAALGPAAPYVAAAAVAAIAIKKIFGGGRNASEIFSDELKDANVNSFEFLNSAGQGSGFQSMGSHTGGGFIGGTLAQLTALENFAKEKFPQIETMIQDNVLRILGVDGPAAVDSLIKSFTDLDQKWLETGDSIAANGANAFDVLSEAGDKLNFDLINNFDELELMGNAAWQSLGAGVQDTIRSMSEIWNETDFATKTAIVEYSSIGSPLNSEIEVPALAKGGIVTRPTLALIGEAGAEEVRPLSGSNDNNQVDRLVSRLDRLIPHLEYNAR